ncbi:MAG: hypothetical protein CVU63_09235 [Deltaproteobacteria bacterium HGW-Deltaproteobacteria-20]|nr:MAG: hypothetical protein CVU63_09235 [Deltaproteobacteria bacterium HGW-Deltaproteobacteria-20]
MATVRRRTRMRRHRSGRSRRARGLRAFRCSRSGFRGWTTSGKRCLTPSRSRVAPESLSSSHRRARATVSARRWLASVKPHRAVST